LSGHFGQDKTFAQVNAFYFWPKMQTHVKKFVEKCKVCQYAKGRSQNTGLYQPLPIPDRSWVAVSMDFVMGLPKTHRGNDSIYVVVDGFSKMAHFIACKKINDATHIANLFFYEILRLCGLPMSIVSDRDTKFVGNFSRTLWKKLGTKLSFSSAYHPQTDGQTKLVNRSLGDILRSLVHQNRKQWDLALAQAEFAYNGTPNRSIGMSPFQIIFGMHLRGVYELRELGKQEARSESAEYFVEQMLKLQEEVKGKLQESSKMYKQIADLKRKEKEF